MGRGKGIPLVWLYKKTSAFIPWCKGMGRGGGGVCAWGGGQLVFFPLLNFTESSFCCLVWGVQGSSWGVNMPGSQVPIVCAAALACKGCYLKGRGSGRKSLWVT